MMAGVAPAIMLAERYFVAVAMTVPIGVGLGSF